MSDQLTCSCGTVLTKDTRCDIRFSLQQTNERHISCCMKCATPFLTFVNTYSETDVRTVCDDCGEEIKDPWSSKNDSTKIPIQTIKDNITGKYRHRLRYDLCAKCAAIFREWRKQREGRETAGELQ